MKITTHLGLLGFSLFPSILMATTYTETSPTVEGALPAGVSTIGGIVFDAVGLNGSRLVSQLAASSLYIGYADTGSPVAYRGNPLTIGIQTGIDLSSLGGGFSEFAVRFTLDDGDTASGNFDFNDNSLLINGLSLGTEGNWSAVPTQRTDSAGTTLLSSSTGFRNNTLDTGWFHITDSTVLASAFSAINLAGEIVFQSSDIDPNDNYYDFTQGIDASLIDVSLPPVVTPPTTGGGGGMTAVPEVGTMASAGAFGLLAGLGFWRRRRTA
jgi:hypothetical protein